MHDDKYNYSQVTEQQIKNARSNVPISCNTCGYFWTPTVFNHINSRNGCPNCAGKARWTLDRFVMKATAIHGDRYDYSQIKDQDVEGGNSKVPVLCKVCGYCWNPVISDHINSKSGCPDCAGNVPWIRATGPNLGLALLVLDIRSIFN